MKAVVAAFNQEKALVGAFSMITNLRMEFFEALVATVSVPPDKSVGRGDGVEVALLPIVHKRVRFPYFPQHLY